MPRRWRKVIQRTARDADWQSGARMAIESALMTELREMLSNPSVRLAAHTFEQRQGSLLPPDVVLPAGRDGEIYSRFRDHFCIHYLRGRRGEDLIKEALGSALGEALTARSREVIAHTAARDGRSVAEMRTRLAEASRGVVDQLVERLQAPASPASSLTFDLDETDLLRGFK